MDSESCSTTTLKTGEIKMTFIQSLNHGLQELQFHMLGLFQIFVSNILTAFSWVYAIPPAILYGLIPAFLILTLGIYFLNRYEKHTNTPEEHRTEEEPVEDNPIVPLQGANNTKTQFFINTLLSLAASQDGNEAAEAINLASEKNGRALLKTHGGIAYLYQTTDSPEERSEGVIPRFFRIVVYDRDISKPENEREPLDPINAYRATDETRFRLSWHPERRNYVEKTMSPNNFLIQNRSKRDVYFLPEYAKEVLVRFINHLNNYYATRAKDAYCETPFDPPVCTRDGEQFGSDEVFFRLSNLNKMAESYFFIPKNEDDILGDHKTADGKTALDTFKPFCEAVNKYCQTLLSSYEVTLTSVTAMPYIVQLIEAFNNYLATAEDKVGAMEYLDAKLTVLNPHKVGAMEYLDALDAELTVLDPNMPEEQEIMSLADVYSLLADLFPCYFTECKPGTESFQVKLFSWTFDSRYRKEASTTKIDESEGIPIAEYFKAVFGSFPLRTPEVIGNNHPVPALLLAILEKRSLGRPKAALDDLKAKDQRRESSIREYYEQQEAAAAGK